ncbi:hypothetical protein [Mucilaginibacter sp. L3T2-6]|uniref:hypothetical protein n=1 Tax=Mucilaginibacter sp. L3T2-6 TaxID=3062491 RepID=UPI0026744457|nr:hypothetical protein [Mucilaginibacter sp. L3T2-6]MDO3644718.1 hypothetical protein [Mucilaginibacter sp. L3T2-6]MDV6217170.1 hypothetical protein [Mucilaginibacter sp. L3T2-6]
MPIRNQIEAVVQTLTGSPTFIYGTANEHTSAGSFAQKISGVWTVVYILPAANAADGTLLYGAGIPGSGTGKDLDSYINTLTGIFYKKSAGSWSQVFTMATGPQGPQGVAGTNGTNGTNGNTILFGAINPSNTSTGVNGDFYINTSSYTLFGPKTAGVWGDAVSLLGTGLQAGGAAGQVLVKVDDTDYNTKWQDNSFANLSGAPADNPNLATALSAKQDNLGFTPEDTANKNTANGYPGLDGSGKIASAQLPSYVDDVLEFATFAALPANGETGKIYVTLDTNAEYRWSGSAYIQIVASPGTTDAVPEGSTNLYLTAARVISAILTGIGFSSATAVTATDTILGAIGKLQAQITGLFKIPAGGSAGQVLAKIDGADGNTQWITPSGGSGSPGGADKQIQFNSSGAFGGSSKLTFDGSDINVNNGGIYLGNSTKDASALLQADSSTQGVLIPRMTKAQRLAITSPSIGLQVYQTDAGTYGEGIYQYKSTGWTIGIGGGIIIAREDLSAGISTPLVLINQGTKANGTGSKISFRAINAYTGIDDVREYAYIAATETSSNSSVYSTLAFYTAQNNVFSSVLNLNPGGIEVIGTTNMSAGAVIGGAADTTTGSGHIGLTGRNLNFGNGAGYNFDFSTAGGDYKIIMRLADTNHVSIGDENYDNSAVLTLNSTTNGFLPPRMTTTQRDSIGTPSEGLIVYNKTSKKLNLYNGTGWQEIAST